MTAKAAADLFAVVGPNGSGKSSALYAMQVDDSLTFVNPDDIARIDFSHIKDIEERNRLAWMSCNAQREALLSRRLSFGFETVGSHPGKVEFLGKAKSLGYTIALLFVATEDPEINLQRIKHRVVQGGHDVPEEVLPCCHEFYLLLPSFTLLSRVRTRLYQGGTGNLAHKRGYESYPLRRTRFGKAL
jgi:predicted ABC-type ATPase